MQIADVEEQIALEKSFSYYLSLLYNFDWESINHELINNKH